MRKYDVYNLKVVKVETPTNTKYFICRYNNLTQEYIEVLTGQKIEVKNSENVEPLSNYYSVLGLHCYGMPGSKLELNKNDILSKYLEINSEELEKTEEKNIDDISQMSSDTFMLRDQENLEAILLYDEMENKSNPIINYFPTNKKTKSLFLDDDQFFSEPQKNKELKKLSEGLKKTRQELIDLCKTNPEQAKELAIEALIRTGVIESSDEVEKGKTFIKERKDK